MVGEREIGAVIRLFSQIEREYEGQYAASAADNARQKQQQMQMSLFEGLTDWIQFAPHAHGAVSNLRGSYIPSLSNGDFQIATKGATHIVHHPSRLPVLEPSDFEEIKQSAVPVTLASNEYCYDFVALVIAGFLRATRLSGADGFGIIGGFGTGVRIAIARLEAFEQLNFAARTNTQTAHGLIEDVRTRIESFAGEFRDRQVGAAAAFEGELSSIRERTQKTIEASHIANQTAAAFESRVNEIAEATEKATAKAEAEYGAAVEKARAYMEAVRTEANFDDLKIHWIDRGKAAARAYAISSVVLGILLVAVPILAIWENQIIATFIKGLIEAAAVDVGPSPGPVTVAVATISRLVIITVPLALYFWLIKLVVRFNMRSMLLMDDARQRATMLETYYRMIEKSAATKEDRALVLQALMRPAPGHGSDSVDPPNFTEVIDKAMGRNAA